MVPVCLIRKLTIFTSCHLRLDHEPQPAVPLVGGQRGGHPVEIAGVVDRDHRAAAVGNVLQPEIGDPGPDRPRQPSRRSPASGKPVPSTTYPGAPAGPAPHGGPPSPRPLRRPSGCASASVGAPPPSRCGTQNSPGGIGPVTRPAPARAGAACANAAARSARSAGSVGVDRFADGDRDRHLGPPHLLRMPLGPDALSAPDDVRDDRHVGGDRHPRGTRLELLDLEAAADRGLGVDADQLAFLELQAGLRRTMPRRCRGRPRCGAGCA